MHKPLGKEKRHPRGNVRNILYLCGGGVYKKIPGEQSGNQPGEPVKKSVCI